MMDMPEEASAGEAGRSPFPATLWTLVLEAARGGEDEQSQAALRQLCVLYREPIRAWLQNAGETPEDADDLTHGFLEYLLEENRLKNIGRHEGKFRSFLLVCLKRYVRGEWRKRRTRKRGVGEVPVSIEEDQVGIWPDLDRRLDHGFALTVHRQALAQLEAKHAQPPKPARFRALRPYILANDRLVSYAELGQQLGMTANHVSKEVFDLRQQYLRTFRQVVTQTANGESVDEEMRYLIELLAHWGAES